MRAIARVSISAAALCMALSVPGLTYAQSDTNLQSSPDSANLSDVGGQAESQQMVPAQAYLLRKLEAKSVKAGDQFSARLSQNVHLKNGQELPKGTELIGAITADDMQLAGTSKFALRIDNARLKDGTMVPVKATIVGLSAPDAPGGAQSNQWAKNILVVDQLNAEPGVEMHSRIDGRNSGVFVSTRKDNVKISAGSELSLAIAGQNNAQQAAGNNAN